MNQLERALKMKPSRLFKKIFCFEEVYTIAYRNRDGHTLLESDTLKFNRIPYDNTYWYADPILVSHQGNTYLFMESYDMRTLTGSIACAQFDEQGMLSKPQVIIEEPYHMSFPLVFSWKDCLYMIPETCGNHSLNLYRCEGDITRWSLIESFPTKEPLVDTVVAACHEDRVELLCSAIRPDDTLQHKWQKFELVQENNRFRLEEDTAFNACTDYNYTDRMAGAVVKMNDAVILPTQESTEIDYGVNVNLNDFTDKDVTKMNTLRKITLDNIQVPDVKRKQLIGIHSYAVSEQLEVVDVRYFHFTPLNRMRKIVRKIQRRLKK